MTRALAEVPRPSGDLIAWTDEQVALIKRTVAKDCTDDEFKLFLYQCRRTGLDPLAKQIYAVKRAGRMTIQTGIDGFRLTADRTHKLAGSDDAVFVGTPGTKDFAATVAVYKIAGGIRCPFTATARWSEYFPGDAQGAMWKKMPHAMLGKCAEALALRKAFPADLSGLYTAEEMAQAGPVIDVTPTPQKALPLPADTEPSTPPADAPPPREPGDDDETPIVSDGPQIPKDDTEKITLPQRRRLFGIAKSLGFNEARLREEVKRITGQESTGDLRQRQYDRLISNLEAAAGVPAEGR